MNDLKKGKLTAQYLGLMEWGYKLKVPTCNVYHEHYTRYPVATFHHSLAVCFKSGVTWYPDDLADLVEIRKQWELECDRITREANQQQDLFNQSP